jgi:hypothetical protein
MSKLRLLFLALTLLMLSFSVLAETGEQVCQTMPSWQEQQDCLNRIQGQYIDIDAGNVCIRTRYPQARMQCLNVSLNKEYSIEEAQSCNQLFYDQERVDCMQRTGFLIITDPRSRARFDQINRMSVEGLRAVQAGNAQAAYYWF